MNLPEDLDNEDIEDEEPAEDLHELLGIVINVSNEFWLVWKVAYSKIGPKLFSVTWVRNHATFSLQVFYAYFA